MKLIFPVLVAAIIFVTSADANARGRGGSRPYYGGGHHTSSHGGSYAGGRGSSHSGGTYKNIRTSNRYGRHK